MKPAPEMKPPPDDAWAPWVPGELAARLGGVNAIWYVVGGWALDLWHGRQTRDHDDLEFAVLADHVRTCRDRLSELNFFAAKDGKLVRSDPALPVPPDIWQLWGADLSAGSWRVDMMIERGTPDRWHYKRAPSLQLPRAAAVRRTAAGVPFLAPANVLLFKAKHRRAKDEQDFHAALPKLPDPEKAQLRRWLEELHPGHDWIGRL